MPPVKKTIEDKLLKEIKATNKLLKEIRFILDGMWNERLPQGDKK